jgi:twitching motility protein PilT
MHIDDLLRAAWEARASDLHLKPGSCPYVRVDGELSPLTQFPSLTPQQTLGMALSLMDDLHRRRFEGSGSVDLQYEIENVSRFRANAFRHRGTVGLALRLIPRRIPTIRELNLPAVVEQFARERRGLVLATGATSNGKSTALAAMVDYINASRPDHIITIEDPIEFVHSDRKGFVNQQEVGTDTPSFVVALRAALRQDPNVIMLGEMRDLDTISTALTAAETGHLVLSTLHTLDATETIQRIIAQFPLADQKQVRLQLAATLKGVLSLRLVKRSGGGRVPAVEVMVATDYIRECICDPEKTHLIRQAIVSGVTPYGMQSFDQSLYDLQVRGLVSLEEAFARATNPGEFRLRVEGVRSAGEATREAMEEVEMRRGAKRPAA